MSIAADPTTTTDSSALNALTNGDFQEGTEGYETSGSVTVVPSAGPSGGNAVEMEAEAEEQQLGKRSLGDATLSALLHGLEEGTSYTVLFFYAIVSNDNSGTCRLSAYWDSNHFYNTEYFTQEGESVSVSYISEGKDVQATSSSASLSLVLSCKNGGSARVYIGSILVNNQATSTSTTSATSESSFQTTTAASTNTPTSTSTTPGGTTPGDNASTSSSSSQTTSSSTSTNGSSSTTPGGSTSTSTPGTSVAESVSTTSGGVSPGESSSTTASSSTESLPSPAQTTPGSNTQAADPGSRSSSETVGQESTESTAAVSQTGVGYNTQTVLDTSDSYALPTISVTSDGADVTNSASLTTSTVYTTHIYTVTKCPPSVTNCPAGGYVTTEVVALYTTVCPMTENNSAATKTVGKSHPEMTNAPDNGEVQTVYATNVHTITKCPPEVTNCPIGSVTTEVSSWTSTVDHSIKTVVVNIEENGSETSAPVEKIPEATIPVYNQETGLQSSSPVEEVPEATASVNSQDIASISSVSYEEVPEAATTTTEATAIIYKTVVVPPSTFTSLNKPAATDYHPGAESTSKRPQGGAAPTGGCIGEHCSATTYTHPAAAAATSQPVTAGASATVRAGLVVVSVMTVLQMFIL